MNYLCATMNYLFVCLLLFSVFLSIYPGIELPHFIILLLGNIVVD